MKFTLLLSLLLPLTCFAIDLPSGVGSPATSQPGTRNSPATTGTVDEWTTWGLSQLEAARKRSAIDYAISNPVEGARCIYSIDRAHPTDTIDVDPAGAGYKVSCFATKQNKPDIYVLTYSNVITKSEPAECATEAKIREHFNIDVNRKPSAIPLFNLKFLTPGCSQIIDSVQSADSKILDLKKELDLNFLQLEMDRRVGLKKPAEKAINTSHATRTEPSGTGTGPNDGNCLPGNPLCESSTPAN